MFLHLLGRIFWTCCGAFRINCHSQFFSYILSKFPFDILINSHSRVYWSFYHSEYQSIRDRYQSIPKMSTYDGRASAKQWAISKGARWRNQKYFCYLAMSSGSTVLSPINFFAQALQLYTAEILLISTS